ncbi:MAG: zinc-dependent metalloprotease, partial [Lapillicoccus sp.]
MAERPDHGDEADQPDESTGIPSSADPPSADRSGEPTEPGDGWSGAVDHPASSGPTDAPTDRPRMGFSGGGSPGPQDRRQDDDDDPNDFGELGAMLQQLMGGGRPGAGGSGMPDLGELVRQLGGSGGMPDLDALMRQLGGAGGLGGAGEAIEQMWKQMGIDPRDSGAMGLLQNQMQQFFGAQTPQDRMTMSTDVARKTVAGDKDPTVTAAQQREVDEAVRVAQLWIDPVTSLSAPAGTGLAWSRAEWVEATMPTWHRLVEPVADGVAAAMTAALDGQLEQLTSEGGLEGLTGLEGLPQIPGLDLGQLLGQLQPALRQLAGSMFSAQLGHGVGALANDLLSATEVGLPLLTTEDVALLPANIAAFTQGLEVDAGEVRLYLAVREAARARLFAQVPWLGPQL